MECPSCGGSNIHHIIYPPTLPDLRQAATCRDCGLIFIEGEKYNHIKNPAPGPAAEPVSARQAQSEAPAITFVTCPFCLGAGKLSEQKYRYIVEKMVKHDDRG